MKERQVLMRHFSSSLSLLASSLCLTLLAPSSFGSDRSTQEDTQEKIITPASTPQITVLSSPEGSLPHDIRIYILSFLTEQRDILRIGAISTNWRKAAQKVWESRALNLSCKSLTEADYKALARGIFPCLTLNYVKIKEEEMQALAACSQLQALDLCNNSLLVIQFLTKLLSLSNLSDIDLKFNRWEVKGVKPLTPSLKALTSLTTVSLNHNALGDEGTKAIAAVLAQNKTLTEVQLGFNTIGDVGAQAIAAALHKNKTLTIVNLISNNIGDEGTKAIAVALHENKTLTTVNLCVNRIGEAGAKAIAAAIAQNKTLTTIVLGLNMFGIEGAIAIAAALKDNKTLAKLNLGNNIGVEGAKAIAEMLKKNNTLTTLGLDGFDFFEDDPDNTIGIEGAIAIAAALKENKTLTMVNLSGNRIGDEGRQALDDLKRSKPSLKLIY